MFSHNDIIIPAFPRGPEVHKDILTAGLLTLLPGEKRLPEKISGILFFSQNSNSQQRDCTGFPPDSLLIAKVCKPFSGAKVYKKPLNKCFC